MRPSSVLCNWLRAGVNPSTAIKRPLVDGPQLRAALADCMSPYAASSAAATAGVRSRSPTLPRTRSKSRKVIPDEESQPFAVMTIGHSRHTAEEFIRLLKAHGVEQVVDVRTVPRSQRNPQFNRDALPAALRAAKIGYVHLPQLGGLRRPKADSRNTAWRNASFRGYADYMQTPEFDVGLEALIDCAGKKRVAIMCAEAVPWRCHRSLIADALLARGIPSEHIMTERRRDRHKLTPWARVRGERVTYPGEPPLKGQRHLQFDED